MHTEQGDVVRVGHRSYRLTLELYRSHCVICFVLSPAYINRVYAYEEFGIPHVVKFLVYHFGQSPRVRLSYASRKRRPR